jgi:hypothetical protein
MNRPAHHMKPDAPTELEQRAEALLAAWRVRYYGGFKAVDPLPRRDRTMAENSLRAKLQGKAVEAIALRARRKMLDRMAREAGMRGRLHVITGGRQL